MHLAKDFKEFIGFLNSNCVEYVIVGGYALAFHGAPRYTGDIDILVRYSAANAARLENALVAFGFASLGISAKEARKNNFTFWSCGADPLVRAGPPGPAPSSF